MKTTHADGEHAQCADVVTAHILTLRGAQASVVAVAWDTGAGQLLGDALVMSAER
jgi:hypothetical protein